VTGTALKGRESYVDLSSVDLGVLYATIDGNDLPWSILSNAKVELKYADWNDTFTVVKNQEQISVAHPIGKTIDQELQYRVTLNFVSGPKLEGEWKNAVTNGDEKKIRLEDPFNGTKTVRFYLGDDVKKVQLRALFTFSMPSDDQPRKVRSLIRLNSDDSEPEEEWVLPIVENGKFSIIRARVDGVNLTATEEMEFNDDIDVTVNADGLEIF
jgi:hypothetical protein